MLYVGLDIHSKHISVCVLNEAGQGVTQDFGRAASLYRRACESRHGEACFRLAGLYEKGAGVRRDPDRATSTMRRACESGYAEACPKPKGT